MCVFVWDIPVLCRQCNCSTNGIGCVLLCLCVCVGVSGQGPSSSNCRMIIIIFKILPGIGAVVLYTGHLVATGLRLRLVLLVVVIRPASDHSSGRSPRTTHTSYIPQDTHRQERYNNSTQGLIGLVGGAQQRQAVTAGGGGGWLLCVCRRAAG